MLKRDWIFGLIVALFFIYFSTLTNSGVSLSPPSFTDDYTKDLSANSNIYSWAKVGWDGSTNYVRTGAGTGSLDGTFTSKTISMGQSSSNLKVSWVGTSDVQVLVSTNNWASSCYATNGQYLNNPGCPLPTSSFRYRVKLPNAALPSKIDVITFDWGAPVTCGNNLIEQGEQCDGSNLNSQTCMTLGQGFTGGILSCIAPGLTNQCIFNTSACTSAVCGNGIIEGAEKCDDQNVVNGDGCSNICQVEGGWKCSGQPSKCLRFKVGSIVGENQLKFQCSDELDNDNDGAIDYPHDFSCGSFFDNDEANPKAQCKNGIDDDGNGVIDWPADGGCDNAQDNEEFGGSAGSICGNGVIEVGETCDDLNSNNDDGCSSSCNLESGYTCTGQPSVCAQTNVNLECPVGYCLPRDAQGWTNYTPSSDSQFVYVSNAGDDNVCKAYTLAQVGDPYNPSGSVVPCASVGVGISKLRSDMPDWLLLKRGDSWHTPLGEWGGIIYQWLRSGRSYNEPMVVTTYGSSTKRPVLHTANGFSGITPDSGQRNYLAFNGLEFISNRTGLDSADGFVSIAGGKNVLIEDCKFEGYSHGLNVQSSVNFTLRRSQIVRSWSIDSGYFAQGTFVANTQGFLYQENLDDFGGWNADIPSSHDLIFIPNKTISEWTAVTNGKFNISFYNRSDPNWNTQIATYLISGLDFSTSISLADVAAKIQNAVNTKAGYNLLNVTAFYYSRNGQTYFLFSQYNQTTNQPVVLSVTTHNGVSGTDISGSVYYGNQVGYLNGPGGYAGATEKKHATYFAYGSGNRNLYFLDNIISRASANGISSNDNDVIKGNLIVQTPIPIHNRLANSSVENNIIINSRDITPARFPGDLRWSPRGYGISNGEEPPGYSGDLTYRNNIIANNKGSGNIWGILLGKSNSANRTITIDNNIVYNWSVATGGLGLYVASGNPWSDNVIVKNNFFQEPVNNGFYVAHLWFEPQTFDSVHFKFVNNTYYMPGASKFWVNSPGGYLLKNFAEWVALSGEIGAVNQQVTFIDPSRSVEKYSASLGKPATLDYFMDQAKSQSRLDWKTEYTAPAVNQYIRDGFAIGGGRPGDGRCGDLDCSPKENGADRIWLDILRDKLRGVLGLAP